MDANGPAPAPEPDPDRPADPDTWDEAHYTRAWEAIVADLTSRQTPAEQVAGSGAAPEPAPRTSPGTPATPTDGLAALFEPLRRASQPPPDQKPNPPEPESAGATQDAAAARAKWEDEGHFVAPPPPDLPEGTPLSRLAWVGTLGGPAVLLGSALTGIELPQVVAIAAGLAALAGFATLVWLLPDSREDSGWDDGAQL